MSSHAAPAQPSLVVTGGAKDGDVLVLEAPTVEKMLGSGSSAHMRVDAKNVEALHASVAWEARGLVLTDRASATGTFVNGERVRAERVLQEGDNVCLGPPGSRETLTLVVHLPDGFGATSSEGEEAFLFVGEEEEASAAADGTAEPLILDEPGPPAPAPGPREAAPGPPAATPAIIFDGESAPPAPAAAPTSPVPARGAASASRPHPDYQTDVSIGGDRVRAPLEVPPVATPHVRTSARAPTATRARGARPPIPRAALLGVGVAVLAAAALVVFSRLHRPPPVLASVSPAKAEPGGTVIIRGTGFVPTAEGQAVRFGDALGAVTAATDTQLTATVPGELMGAGAAEVPVVVERGRARSNALSLQILRLPRVTGLEPEVALPGAALTIRGQNLAGKAVAVRVGTQRVEVKDAQATALRVAVPEMAWTEGQSVPVVVEVGRDASRPVPLFFGRMPLVIEVSPTTGPVGQRVTLKGRGFDPSPGANRVSFGGERAIVIAATATELQTAVPVPPGGAPPGPLPILVEARGGTSAGQAQFLLERPSSALYRPRFFPAPVPQPSDRYAFVSSELGPFLLLTGRADAPSTAERAFRVASALTAAMEAAANAPATVEVRAGAAPAVAVKGGPVLVTASADDSEGYAQPWDAGARPAAHLPPDQIGSYWAALIQDYLSLFGQGQRPTHTVELSSRGKVLLDLYADAERRGLAGGVPISILNGLTPATARGIRELALVAPGGAAAGTPSAAVAGRWEGSMDDAGTERSMALHLHMEGPRLAGSLTTKMGTLAVDIPLQQLTYDKGLLKFVAAVGGASKQFQGKVEGATLTGEIKDKTGRQAVGRFNVRYVE
jgi:hypothetical protein